MTVIRRIRMDDVKKFVVFKNKSSEESDYINRTTEEKAGELFKNTLDWSGLDAFLMLEGGKIIGQLWLEYRDLDNENKASLQIQLISILGGYRRKGYAGRLLKHAEEEAISRGCVKITLTVAKENKEAIALYERHGYTHNPNNFKHISRIQMEKKVGKRV